MITLAENPIILRDSKFKELTGNLKKWLSSNDDDFVQFRRWLTGYEIPILSRERQNYGWILEGLKIIGDNSYFQKLAEKTADFLTNVSPEKYLKAEEKYDDEFLYNLYYLCVGLEQKEILAKPLQKQYQYFKHHTEQRNLIFTRKGFYDVSDAFREALISNQIDETYLETWNAIIERNSSAFLFTYNIDDGFRGINLMPSTADANLPNFVAIGKALKLMANYLENLPERNKNFYTLIERVHEVWSKFPQLEMEIYEQAIENSFPGWATDEILLPIIQINSKTIEITRYDVWACIPNALLTIENNFNVLGSGFVITIEVPNSNKDTIYFLNNIFDKVETVRQQTSKESFPFQIKAIAEEVFHFRDILHYSGNYKYSNVANDIFKNLRSFHQREEFKSQTEELYNLA